MSFLRMFSLIFLSITAPAGIVSNIIVIVTFCKQNHFTICSNIFFTHLAIVDLLVCISGCLVGLGVNLFGGVTFCKASLVVIVLFYCLSTGNLCLLTYDRFMYISRPLKYFYKMDSKRAKTFIAALWVISLINIIPVVTNTAFAQERGPNYNLDIKNCIMSKIVNKFYFIWIAGMVMIFLLATITFNLRILAYARGQGRKIEESQKRIPASIPTEMQSQFVTYGKSDESGFQIQTASDSMPATTHTFTRVSPRKRQNKALRTILCIVLIHCICTLPYVLFVVAEIICGFCFEYRRVKFAYSLYLLNYLNSVFDPVIYVCLNSDLRRAVKKMLKSLC